MSCRFVIGFVFERLEFRRNSMVATQSIVNASFIARGTQVLAAFGVSYAGIHDHSHGAVEARVRGRVIHRLRVKAFALVMR